LFQELTQLGVTSSYPKVDTNTMALEYYKVDALHSLCPGFQGILEPPKGSQKTPSKKIDLLIVPGVVFDQLGYRIGYGMGCYDRMLSTCPAKRIGLAYEFQRVQTLPHSKSDVPMDVIVTEKQTYRMHE